MSNWLDRKADSIYNNVEPMNDPFRDKSPVAFIEGSNLFIRGTAEQINELESVIKQVGLYGDVTTDSVSGTRWFRIDVARIPTGKAANYIKGFFIDED